MTPIRSILMIAATLTLISSASAQGPELPSTALGYRSHLLIPASFVHAVEASELAVLNPLTQVLGTAQVRHNSWRHRTRTLTVSAIRYPAVNWNVLSDSERDDCVGHWLCGGRACSSFLVKPRPSREHSAEFRSNGCRRGDRVSRDRDQFLNDLHRQRES